MKKTRSYLIASLLFLLSFNWSTAQCLIENVTVSAHSCDGDWFSVNIHFDVYSGTDSVTIAGNGNQYGTFSSTDLPITLGPFLGDNSTIYEFVVSDYQNACSDFGVVGPIDCSASDCSITDLIAEAHPCNGDGAFLVDINFNHQNMPSDSFRVVGNGTHYGTFAYADLWITIGPIIGDGNTVFEFIVIDQTHPNCFEETGLDPINCSTDCEISGIEIWDIDCNGTSGTYNFNLNFGYSNVTNDFFDVFANGEFFGFYAFADLPLTIENFPLSGNPHDVLTICQNDLPSCCTTLEFDSPNCGNSGDCEIGNIQLWDVVCNANDTYDFNLSIDYANVTNDFFEVFADGNYFGIYAFADLPVHIEGYPASGNAWEIIQICQNDLGTCCESLQFVPNCALNCEFSNLVVEAHPCNADGFFNVDIDFDYQDMPSDSFTIVGNGNNYGTFAYTDLFVTIGPLLGDGVTAYEFIINDSQNPICKIEGGLDPINCNPDCAINDIEISEIECNPDNTYNFNLNFNYTNVNNDFFDVYANGNFFGYYAFADLPLTIEDFPMSGNVHDVIKICQNDLPTCCETYEFESPNCAESCLTFNDLPTGYYGTPTYTPDDLVFTVSGVPVKIQEYEGQFDGVSVNGNPSPFFDGNYLSPFMANLEFNFLQLNAAVIHMEFDFYNGGGGINIGANDAPINSASSLFDLDGVEIAPGVTLTIVPDPTDPIAGRAILDGFIGLFTIGANDALDFDNICLEYDALGDCWPGDTNSDYISNNFDLLNIGLAYGTEGTPRDDASIAWLAQPSDDWTEIFEDGTNYKHADSNGDGIINAQDKFAIDENFGLTHGNVDPYVSPIPSSDDPAFFIVMPDPNDIALGSFEAEIHLGATANAIDAIYGLAFTVEFNNQIFDASSMEIAFESGWFNNSGTDDLLSIQKEEDGKLAAAVSRINHINISGGGKIGTISGIIDDLSGYAEIELGIIDVKGITTNETLVPFHTPENYVEVGTGIIENKLSRNLTIFPNPASNLIFIKNENEAPIQNIRLINILGQEVLEKSVSENGLVELNVEKISEGIYFLEIQMDGFKVTRKIEISHP